VPSNLTALPSNLNAANSTPAFHSGLQLSGVLHDRSGLEVGSVPSNLTALPSNLNAATSTPAFHSGLQLSALSHASSSHSCAHDAARDKALNDLLIGLAAP